eukprot:TRINITY_DN2377_c0_g1_i1.p1 TRINITY_DN2377_c0_g1~~TRINITY_DN2377_c0_g1_i1.p1  ORF type:complete len:278 (-),score=41.36 TRINITY_DN2377_c0_g1_i1:97-930(-)
MNRLMLKVFSERHFLANGLGQTVKVEKLNLQVVSTQNEVLDFPKQHVISRDNATVYLDAVLSYKIVNPKQMLYSCNNLPDMLSKLMQAALRNVAGTLELDQIIEDTASLNILTGALDQEASRWGVKILFVKIQNVNMPTDLKDVLSAKKDADLRNQEIIIGAKAKKQTMVIESEGTRDALVRRAEGEASEMLARARGDAQAIVNKVKAEERSIREISRAISKFGEDPARYLLSLKYIEALRNVAALPATEVHMFPDRSALVQVLQQLGINTAFPVHT